MKTYTAVIKQTERGWFWHVAQDWKNGRGWNGESPTEGEAIQQVHERLQLAVASG